MNCVCRDIQRNIHLRYLSTLDIYPNSTEQTNKKLLSSEEKADLQIDLKAAVLSPASSRDLTKED